MRSREAASITGPIWPRSCPGSRAAALSTTALIRSGWSPMGSSTDAAMHRWPVHPVKEPTMSDAAMSKSRSGSASKWFLAPPRASARLPCPRQRLATRSATREEPTKERAVTPGWSHRAVTASTAPLMSWNTPAGTPASCISRAARPIVRGTFSDGFTMTQLPATSAMGTVHMGTMKGKLNGTTQATTPTGSRSSWHVTPRETCKIRPGTSCGIEHAHSTVSLPLATSASASALFLPCSSTIRSASSSACSWTSW
mmetsp:Transcript_12222/g.39089  ORF Transcript_12222/g.39089 Transcript_12222/m.39089 type:complete len:255 (-) Transcript_12222:251-1015(-)